MRIKHVQLSGFKSFCDNTRILFDSSLTAVVGPNGCGKSNIVDAIRWVLGEQSAKNLRGKAMEDVIFNGSATRGPQSLAQVTITFHNDDGLSHPAYADYPEVAVTRRLHRDGTSEYLINKTQCRLKDITDLMLGTGGGARAYSIIEQGRIGLIVSSRSEDRRAMIEEAAGVTRYKSARRVASRKMDQTRQNLLRIRDVVTEMERNLRSLKFQAHKTTRFKRYRAEQRDLELHVAAHEFLELRALAQASAAQMAEAEQGLERAREDLDTREAGVAQRRGEEQSVRTELERARASSFEVDNAIQVLQSEVNHVKETMARLSAEVEGIESEEAEGLRQLDSLTREDIELAEHNAELEQSAVDAARERGELDELVGVARTKLSDLGQIYDAERDQMSRARARIAAAGSAVESLAQRVTEVQERLDAIRADRADLDEVEHDLGARVAELRGRSGDVATALQTATTAVESENEAFERLRVELDECDTERRRVRDELQGKVSRLSSLEELRDGLARHDRAVREAVVRLREEGERRMRGLLVDFIECPAEYEVALAAVLGDQLQGIVADDIKDGIELLEWLKERNLGRLTVLSRTVTLKRQIETTAVFDPAISGKLLDFLVVDPQVKELVGYLLGDVHVVSSGQDAARVWIESPVPTSLVSMDGQVVLASGVMRGGRAESPGADLLVQKRQIRELTDQVQSLKQNHTGLDQRFDALKRELVERRDAADAARQQVQQQEILLVETRKDESRAADELEALQERREGIDREIVHQEELLQQARDDRAQAEAELEETRALIERLERSVAECATEIDACREEVERLTNSASDSRVREAELEQKQRAAVDRKRQIGATATELRDRLKGFEERRRTNAAETGKAAGSGVRMREVLGEKLDEAARFGGEVDELGRSLSRAGVALADTEAEVKNQRARVNEAADRVGALKLARQEVDKDVEHLLESVEERHDTSLLRTLGDYHMRPQPGENELLRIEELKRLISRMGAINPAAIEEYEETQTRYEERTRQMADVEQALEDLERAIARMDRDCRQLFKEAFEVVSARFQEIFPRLFKGGQARLVLTDSEDMLNTGVDIVAQPPGKRLGNIELMSGGEKALTAVSLMLALFLHRPSPFCLLDEVDAPLDEANVGRFIEIVREMTGRSQFIVITHSKVTMEGADALYGVTMEEPGVSKLVSVRLVSACEAASAVNE
ncbi:MAG: chromosome segregation protein SMC [Deltaproteobacteria bacterium]|nr:chromosome segregation protein SMC [Deltaproteobacteria bacterium]